MVKHAGYRMYSDREDPQNKMIKDLVAKGYTNICISWQSATSRDRGWHIKADQIESQRLPFEAASRNKAIADFISLVPYETIHFVDHGQDFLTWDVNKQGIVIDSRPFQLDIWRGCVVTNLKDLKPGSPVEILNSKNDNQPMTIRYAVESVTKPSKK